MNMREYLEQEEIGRLSPYAVKSLSATRQRYKEPCEVRTAFERDRGSIVHCNSFRRLKHKTQVFLSPEGDHYRTRLTHTLEVAQIARVIARGLRLNEYLTEAIAMGHDLGHPPFGHAGERTLARFCPGGFRHNEQSLRVADFLEKNGEGLNLTDQVRDGILCHTGPKRADSLEGRIVHYADRIAYINHDLDDAIRAGVLREEFLPPYVTRELGHSYKQRINTLVLGIVQASAGKPDILMDSVIASAMDEMRNYLFDTVYINPTVKGEESKAADMISFLYDYFRSHPDRLPEFYREREQDSIDRRVCDYIAGMSDSYAVKEFQDLFIPKSWRG